MKIQKLRMRNFSSHEDTILELDRVNVILGSLNAGKSSILQAVDVALTGGCTEYRMRTDNQDEIVRRGVNAERFEIDLESDKGKINRGRALSGGPFFSWENGSQQMVAQNVAEAERKVAEELGLTKEQLIWVLNTGDFFLLDAKTQREAVLAIIGGQFDWEFIRGKFDGDVEALHGVDPITSIEEVDAAYERFYKERADIKRQLTALRPPTPPEGPAPNIESIKKKLEKLRAEQRKLSEQLGLVKGATKLEERERCLSKIGRIEKWLEENPRPTQSQRDEVLQGIATCQEKENEDRNRIESLQSDLINRKAQLISHRKNAELLRDFNGMCVAGEHQCPAEKSVMTKAGKFAEAMTGTMDKEIQELEGMLRMVTEHREKNQVMVRSLTRKSDSIVALEVQISKAEQDLAEEQNTLKQYPEESGKSQEVADLQSQIAELGSRIQKGQSILEQAQDYEFRVKAVEEQAQDRARLEKRRGHLESLVAFLGPKGVKASLIQERLFTFEEKVNGPLSQFGYSISVEPDPWRINVNGHTYKRLSRSERFRLSVAFQIAMAELTGFKFIMIDNAEILIKSVRNTLFDILLSSSLDQAVVVTTTEVDHRIFKAPTIDGVKFFFVVNDEGKSVILT